MANPHQKIRCTPKQLIEYQEACLGDRFYELIGEQQRESYHQRWLAGQVLCPQQPRQQQRDQTLVELDNQKAGYYGRKKIFGLF